MLTMPICCSELPITITLATDDFGTLFINGKEILRLNTFYEPVSITVNYTIRSLALDITNKPFPYNIIGLIGFIMITSNGIKSDQTWKCSSTKPRSNDWVYPDFDDSSWTFAYSYSRNGDGYKINFPPLSTFPNDLWWVSTKISESIVNLHIYCRKNFV